MVMRQSSPTWVTRATWCIASCRRQATGQGCTPEFLDEAIGYAERITRAKLLVWLDAGNDDRENIQVCRKHKADWIITQNLREKRNRWRTGSRARAQGDCIFRL